MNKVNDNLRNKYMDIVADLLKANGEDVGKAKANKLNFPTIDEKGEDAWIEITIAVPTGDRDTGYYDGYEQRDEYAQKLINDSEKAKKKAEEKAQKIAKDNAIREAKAKAKAERGAAKLTTEPKS